MGGLAGGGWQGLVAALPVVPELYSAQDEGKKWSAALSLLGGGQMGEGAASQPESAFLKLLLKLGAGLLSPI